MMSVGAIIASRLLQLYHDENKLLFDKIYDKTRFVLDQHA